jgi:hypothetical protein
MDRAMAMNVDVVKEESFKQLKTVGYDSKLD